MNSHAHNFATDGTTARPTMLVMGQRTTGISCSYGWVSLKGESVT